MKLLLKNGRVVDPANGIDAVRDVLVDGEVISAVDRSIDPGKADEIIECDGLVVAPGFIDAHVHLREPGQEDSETIETGGKAAAAGGFTAVACMPNTVPVNDNQSVTEFIRKQAALRSPVRVYPIGAMTKGQRGEELAEIGDMVQAGCVAISDDGRPVVSAFVMRKALEYARMFDIPVINHAQDLALSSDGVMNEGYHSTMLGLAGINGAAEDVMIYRDIRLSEITGGRLHVPHISTGASVDLIRSARERGARVTCEVTPHHFCLTDEAVRGYDTNTKMNPPLRSEGDRAAMIAGIVDGTIDIIASDHAPHCSEDKEVEYDLAPFGVVGLETSVALGLDRLVKAGHIDLRRFVELYSTNPARILKVKGGTLTPGEPADLTLFSTTRETLVDPSRLRSSSRNTPFAGWKLTGAAVMTVVAGRIVHSDSADAGGSGRS